MGEFIFPVSTIIFLFAFMKKNFDIIWKLWIVYVSCSFAFYVSGPVLISVMHLVLSSSTAGF